MRRIELPYYWKEFYLTRVKKGGNMAMRNWGDGGSSDNRTMFGGILVIGLLLLAIILEIKQRI